MKFSFTSPHGPKGSEVDPECLFFTLNTFQANLTVTCYKRLQDLELAFRYKNTQTDGSKDGQTDVEVEIVI